MKSAMPQGNQQYVIGDTNYLPQGNEPSDFVPPDVPADWFDENWKSRIPITLTHNDGPSVFTGFQLLIKPQSTTLQNQRLEDFRFVKSDKTILDHQIHDYSSTNGTMTAWVRLPTAQTNEIIYLYFNNPNNPPSTDNPTGVWNNHHVMFSCNGTLADDTNNFTLNSTGGGSTSYVAGKVENQALQIPNTHSFTTLPNTIISQLTEFTFYFWVQITTTALVNGGLVELAIGGVNTKALIFIENDLFKFRIRTNVPSLQTIDGSHESLGWCFMTGVVDPIRDRMIFYIDGQEVGSISNVEIFSSTENSYISVGELAGGVYKWQGNIERLGIINSNKSQPVIRAMYENQNDPSTFTSQGSVETIP